MPGFYPDFDQPHSLYYEHYRSGIIQRHICENGRFLSAVVLVEQDPAKTPPDKEYHGARRVSGERIPGSAEPYIYVGYPAIVHDPGVKEHPLDHYVLGGGDNPLLQGGLAMAAFSMEELLGLSDYSFLYAVRLLDFFIASVELGSDGQPTGYPLRRRHWWYEHDEIKYSDASKDELCGLLIGLHFFIKAAEHRRDSLQEERAKAFLRRLASYLKTCDYSREGAWIFQFPFTRVFKFQLGSSYLSGTTFPDDWQLWSDEFLSALMNMYSFFSLDFDFRYKPRDLFRDWLEWLPELYRAAVSTSDFTVVDVDPNFYNTIMYLHCILMILDNPVRKEVREEFWDAFHSLFKYFATSIPMFDGSGDGRENAYLGVVAQAFAKSLGKESDVKSRAEKMYDSLSHPGDYWQHALPICAPTKNKPEHGELPSAVPFRHDKPGQDRDAWGEWFTWEHSDRQGHHLDWHFEKTFHNTGASVVRLKNIVEGRYYHCDLSKGFRVETSGLGFFFTRILASYLGFLPKPTLERDVCHNVLPMDGPPIRPRERWIRMGPSPWLPQAQVWSKWRPG